MPDFSEMGISQISSVIRLTVMAVFNFMVSGRGPGLEASGRDARNGINCCDLYARRTSLCAACLAGSDVEDNANLPAPACLLEFVEMFRDPLHIGVKFLRQMIHRRADQTRTQQPDVASRVSASGASRKTTPAASFQ